MPENPLKSLEGKVVVFRKDPVFGRKGWCLMCGSIVQEMQTMDWVHKLIRKRGSPGDMLRITEGKIERV